MCKVNTPEELQEELKKLPDLIRAEGWSCMERPDRNAVSGSSGPTENSGGITLFTGIPFNVSIDKNDLKVRLAWPAQHTTSIRVDTAKQAVSWLARLMPIADADIKRK